MATVKTSNGCGTTIRTACKFDVRDMCYRNGDSERNHFKRVQNWFVNYVFPFWDFFLDLLFCPFSLLFAAFWSWKLTFQLLLELFM